MKIYKKVVLDIDTWEIKEEESYEYKGEVALCGGGGGGGSGEIGYPDYLENTHKNFLYGGSIGVGADTMTSSIIDLMDTAQTAASPYDSESAFNPNAALTLATDSPLKRASTQFDSADTLISAITATTDWGTYFDTATTKLGDATFISNLQTLVTSLLSSVNTILSNANITNVVTQFENNKKTRFLRDVGVWSAGMADINAVNTSSFIIGLALQQIEFSNSVDNFESQLKLGLFDKMLSNAVGSFLKLHAVNIAQGPELIARLQQMKASLLTDLSKIKLELEKLIIVSKKEQVDKDLAIDVDEALWDLEVYMYGANMLGSISGAAAGRKLQTTTGQSVLGL